MVESIRDISANSPQPQTSDTKLLTFNTTNSTNIVGSESSVDPSQFGTDSSTTSAMLSIKRSDKEVTDRLTTNLRSDSIENSKELINNFNEVKTDVVTNTEQKVKNEEINENLKDVELESGKDHLTVIIYEIINDIMDKINTEMIKENSKEIDAEIIKENSKEIDAEIIKENSKEVDEEMIKENLYKARTEIKSEEHENTVVIKESYDGIHDSDLEIGGDNKITSEIEKSNSNGILNNNESNKTINGIDKESEIIIKEEVQHKSRSKSPIKPIKSSKSINKSDKSVSSSSKSKESHRSIDSNKNSTKNSTSSLINNNKSEKEILVETTILDNDNDSNFSYSPKSIGNISIENALDLSDIEKEYDSINKSLTRSPSPSEETVKDEEHKENLLYYSNKSLFTPVKASPLSSHSKLYRVYNEADNDSLSPNRNKKSSARLRSPSRSTSAKKFDINNNPLSPRIEMNNFFEELQDSYKREIEDERSIQMKKVTKNLGFNKVSPAPKYERKKEEKKVLNVPVRDNSSVRLNYEKVKSLKERFEVVFKSLEMTTETKLNFVIQFSQSSNNNVEKVIELLETSIPLIQKRERIYSRLAQIQTLTVEHSYLDNTTILYNIISRKQSLQNQLSDLTFEIEKIINALEIDHKYVLTYKGVSYKLKMNNDALTLDYLMEAIEEDLIKGITKTGAEASDPFINNMFYLPSFTKEFNKAVIYNEVLDIFGKPNWLPTGFATSPKLLENKPKSTTMRKKPRSPIATRKTKSIVRPNRKVKK